jgi:DNA-binding SARP family transcriptional activator
MAVRLIVLGGFEARLGEGPPLAFARTKAAALLAYLALNAGQVHHRDKLAALLWGGATRAAARHGLRQAVLAIRQALPPRARGWLRVEADTILLEGAGVTTDVAEFERLVARASADALAAAADLYRGDLLAGLHEQSPAFEEWLVAERTRLHEMALEALGRLLAHQTRQDLIELAVRTATRLLALDPLQEPAHRTLMRLYMRQGRRGAGLTQYQICVEVLRRELAAEPEAETKQLYQELLLQTAAVPAPRRRPAGRRGARARRPTGEVPLVGRAAELAQLRAVLDQVVKGRGRVAVVLGEAGIGKSRLVAELAAESVEGGSRVLLGRCHQSERTRPFGPWVDALRAPETPVADLIASLSRPWRVELARLLPEFQESDLPPATTAEDFLRVFDAIAQLLARLASRQPLVLLLEDLHWADEMSLRLLAFLGRRIASWPVLLLATAREEELSEAPALRATLEELRRGQRLVSLVAGALSQTDTGALVVALARTGTDAASLAGLAEQVWKASRGNPFLVVETMRAVGDGPAPSGSGPLPLPEGVHDLVVHRLSLLSERGRRLAAVAAVIGREFEFTLLARAAQYDDAEAAAGVEELIRRRILDGIGERLDFRHDCIRDVAYLELPPAIRSVWHGRVAEAIETVAADNLEPHYGTLALHCREGRRWERAVEYLTRFAESATRTYAHADAARALGEARDLMANVAGGERDGRLVDLALRLAHALYFLRRPKDSLELLSGEHERVERLGDPTLAGPYHFWLANTYATLGHPARAAESAARALAEGARCGDEATQGRAHYVLTWVGLFSGRPADAAEHGRQAIALLQRAGEQWWLAYAHWALGGAYCYTGEFERALPEQARARAVAEAIGNRWLFTYTACLMGWAYTASGEPDKAIAICREGLERAADRLVTAAGLGYLGYAYLESGNIGDAIASLEDAVRRLADFPHRQLEARFTAFLAEACLADGQMERARSLGGRALEVASAAGYEFGIGEAHRALGRVAATAGAAGQALGHFREALEAFTGAQARFEAARVHLELASLEHATTHLRAAHSAFATLRAAKHVERAERLAGVLGVSLD